MTARLAFCLLALMTVACGQDQPAAVENGRLVLTKSLHGAPLFMEGSLTHVRIVRDDGTPVVDRVRRREQAGSPLFDERLPSGSYSLETVERPCDGNCGYLDPPVESTRCEISVRVEAGRRTDVELTLQRTSAAPVSRCVTRS